MSFISPDRIYCPNGIQMYQDLVCADGIPIGRLFMVFKGANIRSSPVKSCPDRIVRLRQLIDRYGLFDSSTGSLTRLTQNVLLDSRRVKKLIRAENGQKRTAVRALVVRCDGLGRLECGPRRWTQRKRHLDSLSTDAIRPCWMLVISSSPLGSGGISVVEIQQPTQAL